MATEIPHVLVVDDSRVDCIATTRVLDRFNVQVTVVEGAMQALEFLDAETDVNLILTDYDMPNMTGYDFLREVKESPRLKHIPVVIMCTNTDNGRIIECLLGGAMGYVIKPIKVEDVPRFLRYM